MRGIRVTPESKERDRLAFAFMSNGISSERQVETAVRQTAALIRSHPRQGRKVVVVAGPVVVHTGGVCGLAELIRNGSVQALLSGNALGVHDVEAALYGTSLGVRLADGRPEEHGHRNHMRAINAIYHAGGVRAAVEIRPAEIRRAVRVRDARRAVRAGRQPARRRAAARHHHRYERRPGRLRGELKGAGLVLCLGSMLHSIATGNMLPAWVKIICVDINPAVATKVSDRGTGQAVGVVTDVGMFLDMLAKNLREMER